MSELRQTLAALARRYPVLTAAARPLLLPLLRALRSAPVPVAETDPAAEALKASKAAALEALLAAATCATGPGIGASANGRDVLMLVVSDLRIDPRVEREARALAAGGYRVTVICPDPTYGQVKNLAVDWGAGITVRFIAGPASDYILARPGFEGELLFSAALDTARDLRPLAIHAHDLNTCLVGLAVGRQTGAHFVADFHEWTSENVHWDVDANDWAPYPEDWKAELQALEARVMSEASAVITVSQTIVDELAESVGRGRRATLIRNVPSLDGQPTRSYLPLKQELGIPEERFLLLYQGGTGPTRLIEPIIEALAFAPGCTFVIRGPSLEEFGKEYRAIAERAGAGDRLILLAPVPSRDVVAAARGADAGIYTVRPLCRNFAYALPNKIFEYTASGLALLVADYPEVRRMVVKHGIGLTFDPYDPKSIAAVINRLIDEPELAADFRRNTQTAFAKLDAEREWQKLVALYDMLPRTGPQAG